MASHDGCTTIFNNVNSYNATELYIYKILNGTKKLFKFKNETKSSTLFPFKWLFLPKLSYLHYCHFYHTLSKKSRTTAHLCNFLYLYSNIFYSRNSQIAGILPLGVSPMTNNPHTWSYCHHFKLDFCLFLLSLTNLQTSTFSFF